MPSAARVVSLLTFIGPANKVSRLPAGTGELKIYVICKSFYEHNKDHPGMPGGIIHILSFE
jgi:hypothetical protein